MQFPSFYNITASRDSNIMDLLIREIFQLQLHHAKSIASNRIG